jgi:hypothetical protein
VRFQGCRNSPPPTHRVDLRGQGSAFLPGWPASQEDDLVAIVHEVAHFCRSVERACGGGPVRWMADAARSIMRAKSAVLNSANSPRRETAAPAGALTKGCSRNSRALLQSTPEATAHSAKDKRND